MDINIVREFEIKRDNQMLVNKIYRIFTHKSPTKDKEKRHVEKITKMRKTTSNSEQQKWRIFRITQENQSMLKRLQDTQSCYDHRSFARDYSKAQTYKKNICEFPPLDPISDRTNYSKGFFPSQTKYKLNPISLNNTGYPKTSSNWTNTRYEDNNLNEKQKILFSKKILFQDLFQCYVKFYLESKKFIISVSTIAEESKSYFMIFESSDDIVKLEGVYKSYEDIINDLDHSVNLNLIILSNQSLNVNYVRLFDLDIYI